MWTPIKFFIEQNPKQPDAVIGIVILSGAFIL
jgi:hypothetical protein